MTSLLSFHFLLVTCMFHCTMRFKWNKMTIAPLFTDVLLHPVITRAGWIVKLTFSATRVICQFDTWNFLTHYLLLHFQSWWNKMHKSSSTGDRYWGLCTLPEFFLSPFPWLAVLDPKLSPVPPPTSSYSPVTLISMCPEQYEWVSMAPGSSDWTSPLLTHTSFMLCL